MTSYRQVEAAPWSHFEGHSCILDGKVYVLSTGYLNSIGYERVVIRVFDNNMFS